MLEKKNLKKKKKIEHVSDDVNYEVREREFEWPHLLCTVESSSYHTRRTCIAYPIMSRKILFVSSKIKTHMKQQIKIIRECQWKEKKSLLRKQNERETTLPNTHKKWAKQLYADNITP
jgi:hypothetical protein